MEQNLHLTFRSIKDSIYHSLGGLIILGILIRFYCMSVARTKTVPMFGLYLTISTAKSLFLKFAKTNAYYFLILFCMYADRIALNKLQYMHASWGN